MTMNKLFELADFFINFDIEKKPKKNTQGGDNTLTQNGGTDRVKPPHFHLYSKKLPTDYYSYEIDLQKLLCQDKVYFPMIINFGERINPGEEGQVKFSKYAKRIYEFMMMKPNVKKPDYLKGCHNNVEAAIRIFNHDADFPATVGVNPPENEKLFVILQEHSDKLKILPKFNICFEYIPKEIRDKYKVCFEQPF